LNAETTVRTDILNPSEDQDLPKLACDFSVAVVPSRADSNERWGELVDFLLEAGR